MPGDEVMFSQNNNKVLLPIVLFLVLTGIIQTVAQPDVGNSELLDRTFEDFLQGADIDGLVSTLQRLNISFNQISDPAERYTDMAQLNFNLGLLEETKNNTDGALRYFEESRHYAEQALSHRASSEAYRILADAYTQQMKYRGLSFQIANGGKIKEYAESALDLDPDNAKAWLALALYFFPRSAPCRRECRKKYRHPASSLESDTALHPLNRYGILIWLAIGYKYREDSRTAMRYLEEAFRLYPRNRWIDTLLRSHNL
jgi:tetratricopeptide (TPR) repeat protein